MTFHNKSKLKLLVDQAFEIKSEKELEHYLGLFYLYYISYSYKSIPSNEKLFYDQLFLAIETGTSISSQWLDSKQLEEEYGFGLSWQAKRRMQKDKMNFPYYKVGGCIRYKRSEIDQWIEDHKMR